jgi:hypothetical protein
MPEQWAALEVRVAELQAAYDQLTGEKFSDRVHAALRAKLAQAEGTLAAIFAYYGPPQEDCECFMCDMQRATDSASAEVKP